MACGGMACGGMACGGMACGGIACGGIIAGWTPGGGRCPQYVTTGGATGICGGL